MLIDGQEVATTTTSGPKQWIVKGFEIRWQGTEDIENKSYLQVLAEGVAHAGHSTLAPTEADAVELAHRWTTRWKGDPRRYFAVVIAPRIVDTHPGFLIDLEKAVGGNYISLRARYEARRNGPAEIPIQVVREARRVQHRWEDGQTRLLNVFRFAFVFAEAQQASIIAFMFGDALVSPYDLDDPLSSHRPLPAVSTTQSNT